MHVLTGIRETESGSWRYIPVWVGTLTKFSPGVFSAMADRMQTLTISLVKCLAQRCAFINFVVYCPVHLLDSAD